MTFKSIVTWKNVLRMFTGGSSATVFMEWDNIT